MNDQAILSERARGPARRVVGRVRWRELIEQQASSGLEVSAFCRREGLASSSFFAWRKRFKSAFVEVTADAASERVAESSGVSTLPFDQAAIELRLRGDRRLLVRRGFDRQLLLDLIDVLERRS